MKMKDSRSKGSKPNKKGMNKYNFSKCLINYLYWKKGLSTRKIAKIFGCSDSVILDFMKKNNIPRRRCGAPSKVQVTKEMLYDLYWNQGKSTIDIAKKLGVDRTTVFYYFKKFGIPLRKRIEAVSLGAHKKITIHKRIPFSNDPIEKQYLLGISEDFSVCRESRWLIKVALSTSHPAMIDVFQKVFSKYGPIWMYPVKDKIGNFQWRVMTTVDSTFDFLLKSNRFYEMKTLTEEEFFSFLSGLIDSEGSIILTKSDKKYISRAIVIGNENIKLLQEVYEKLKKLGFSPHLYKRKESSQSSKIGNLEIKYTNPLWVVMITNKKDLLRLSQKLTLKNKEKMDKFSLLVETLSAKYWNEIKDKVEHLKREIRAEVNQMKEKARASLIVINVA